METLDFVQTSDSECKYPKEALIYLHYLQLLIDSHIKKKMTIINWIYIQIFSCIKNDPNFTQSKIAIIKTSHQPYTYEASVVSGNFKI